MSQLNTFQPAVTGIFRNQKSIKRTLADLKENNFKTDDIALVDSQEDKLTGITHVNYIPESIERGIVVAVIMGGMLGLMLGFGINSFPRDIFTSAGPVLSAFAGMGIGITVGFFSGLFIGLMENRKASKELKSLIKSEGLLVSVHVNNKREEVLAKDVLVKDGAMKVISPYIHLVKQR